MIYPVLPGFGLLSNFNSIFSKSQDILQPLNDDLLSLSAEFPTCTIYKKYKKYDYGQKIQVNASCIILKQHWKIRSILSNRILSQIDEIFKKILNNNLFDDTIFPTLCICAVIRDEQSAIFLNSEQFCCRLYWYAMIANLAVLCHQPAVCQGSSVYSHDTSILKIWCN